MAVKSASVKMQDLAGVQVRIWCESKTESIVRIEEELAQHYITKTDMSNDDIAFLLGYRELNSFLRAFSLWTGMSVGEYKRKFRV